MRTWGSLAAATASTDLLQYTLFLCLNILRLMLLILHPAKRFREHLPPWSILAHLVVLGTYLGGFLGAPAMQLDGPCAEGGPAPQYCFEDGLSLATLVIPYACSPYPSHE